MYTATMAGLEQVQVQAKESAKTIRDTNRATLRTYLQTAFELQRAGLQAVDALQKGLEELTFNVVERVENTQDKAAADAEARLQQNVQQLREVSQRSSQILQQNNERASQTVEQVRTHVAQQQSNLQEMAEVRATRLREGTEIGVKVAQVIEKRVETMLGNLFQMGQHQLQDVEARIDQLMERMSSQLSEEIQPIMNYDELNVEEIISLLGPLDTIELRVIRKHEVANKNRVTVLRAIDQKLAEKDAVSES